MEKKRHRHSILVGLPVILKGASVTIENCSSSPYYAGSINDLIRTEDNLDNLLQGKYVGGIVGYNVQATIQACNTENLVTELGISSVMNMWVESLAIMLRQQTARLVM